LGTTCSSLSEAAVPQKTHGVVDFVVPVTPQCTGWQRQLRRDGSDHARSGRVRGHLTAGFRHALASSSRLSGHQIAKASGYTHR